MTAERDAHRSSGRRWMRVALWISLALFALVFVACVAGLVYLRFGQRQRPPAWNMATIAYEASPSRGVIVG